jgi:hypothetical protein
VDGITDAPLVPLSLTPASPRVGDKVTVVLGDYFTREQVWAGPPIQLWPLDASFPSGRWFHEVVYGGANELPLRRWARMRYPARMAPVDPRWADEVRSVKDKLQGVFWDVEHAGGPVFAWSDTDLSAGLTVRIDPADSCLQPRYISCARWWYDGSTVTRAELIFPSPDLARDDRNSMHSMGHVIGLNDWPQLNAVMNESHPSTSFHEVERIAVHMMYQHRAAGNVFPDREADPVASASRGVAEARH